MRRFPVAFGSAVAVALAVLPAAKVVAADSAVAFADPVFVTSDSSEQAAEPSIRVDATDPNGRIWVSAPAGIGVNSRSLPVSAGGDLFWYSDDDGQTWNDVGDSTLIGGGDSDVVTGPGDEVYGTGLTLANVTLANSQDNGATWTTNPISNVGAVEDRQWIDGYEDTVAPATAPQFVLNYGGIAESRVWFHQVFAPAGAPPVAGPRIDTTHPDCADGLTDPDCYQWPGNIAVDEATGDVYTTYNTQGSDDDSDDVVVTRIVGGASGPVTPLDVEPHVAADARPDTFDSFTVVAVDRASNVYVVWSERHPTEQGTDTMLAVSQDKGATWSEPVVVNRTPNTTTFPWIVAGDAGRIDIVYYGTTAKGPSPEEVDEESRWQVWMAQSLNALDPVPTFTEVAATADMHEGSICTSGTGCASGTRDLLDYFQIDVDAQGLANIAYTDNLNTPASGSDAHQEWITFVQQSSGPGLFAPEPTS